MRPSEIVPHIRDRLSPLELASRPVHPNTAEALQRRWSELPEHVRTPAQTLGQHAVGCEGRHGVFPGCGWTLRMVHTIGLQRLLRYRRIRPMAFVMHSFMAASVVVPAWEALQRNEISDDPAVAVSQQRLRACSYAMSHPETGELVPACVQHSALDPGENAALRTLLPVTVTRAGGRTGSSTGMPRT